MREKTIYFLFTDTGTLLSKFINYFTKQTLNHVSIGFDSTLNEVYSFGRKRPRNPFIGGFVREDIRNALFKDANCAVYVYPMTKGEWETVVNNVKKIEAEQEYYKYNFMCLLGILFQIKINRKRAFFCSQFAAKMLSDIPSVQLNKSLCFITPADIRALPEMQLVYQGKLGYYQASQEVANEQVILHHPAFRKRMLFVEKIKQLVIR